MEHRHLCASKFALFLYSFSLDKRNADSPKNTKVDLVAVNTLVSF